MTSLKSHPQLIACLARCLAIASCAPAQTAFQLPATSTEPSGIHSAQPSPTPR